MYASISYRIAGYFQGGNFHELALLDVFTGKFSRIPQGTKRLLILAYGSQIL